MTYETPTLFFHLHDLKEAFNQDDFERCFKWYEEKKQTYTFPMIVWIECDHICHQSLTGGMSASQVDKVRKSINYSLDD